MPLRALLLLALVDGATAEPFRGVLACPANGPTSRGGSTAGESNLNFNTANDNYYDIQLGIGTFRFSVCDANYDTWLRVFPGRFEENEGYHWCADDNDVDEENCRSQDDSGPDDPCARFNTNMRIRITEPGWFTVLVEGWSSSAGTYTMIASKLSGTCEVPTEAPTQTPTNPTAPPTRSPITPRPTPAPTTPAPTLSPTLSPASSQPSAQPSAQPSRSPTTDPCQIHTCSQNCVGELLPVPQFDGDNVTELECGWRLSQERCLTVDNDRTLPTSQQDRAAMWEAFPGACDAYTTTQPAGAVPGVVGYAGVGYQEGDQGAFTGGTGTGRTYVITSVSRTGQIQAFDVVDWGTGYTDAEDETLTFETPIGSTRGAYVTGVKQTGASTGDDEAAGLDLIMIILIAVGGCIAILLIAGLMMIRGSSKDPYYYGDESDRPGAVVAFENPQYADGGFNQGGDEPGDGLYDEPDMAQDAGYMDTNEQGDDGDEGDDGFDGSDAEDSEDSE